MFAMFHLGRPDVFPLGDLAVRKGLQELYRLKVSYVKHQSSADWEDDWYGRPDVSQVMSDMSSRLSGGHFVTYWHDVKISAASAGQAISC